MLEFLTIGGRPIAADLLVHAPFAEWRYVHTDLTNAGGTQDGEALTFLLISMRTLLVGRRILLDDSTEARTTRQPNWWKVVSTRSDGHGVEITPVLANEEVPTCQKLNFYFICLYVRLYRRFWHFKHRRRTKIGLMHSGGFMNSGLGSSLSASSRWSPD